MAAGDLRPAHFLGIHAAQLIPLAGAAIVATGLARPQAWVRTIVAGYVVAWIALLAQALMGVPLIRG